MEDYSRYVIDLFKTSFADYVNTGKVDVNQLVEAQKKLAFEIDRCKVNNLPSDELEALYGDVTWLKCDLMGV